MDQDLMLFANKIYMLKVRIDNLWMDAPTRPMTPTFYPIPNEISFDGGKLAIYDKLLRKYYFEVKYSTDVSKQVHKYYGNSSSAYHLKMINDSGSPMLSSYLSNDYYKYISGNSANYTNILNLTKQIIEERGKFFKNKKLINELIEKHKAERAKLTPLISKSHVTQTDKVFLKTFSTIESGTISHHKNLFLTTVGWFRIPAFFFDESLYNLKSNDYKRMNVDYYIHFMPEAALAIITKELMETDPKSNSFFKQGVTEHDVYKAVEQYAKWEKKLMKKLSLEFICKLFAEGMKSFKPDKKKKSQSLTIPIPYMGVEKLKKEELGAVATTIFNYYSLFDRYQLYIDYFNKNVLPKYNKDYENYVEGVKAYNAKVAKLQNDIIATLPYGKADLPYFDNYYELVHSEKFSHMFEVRDYVANIRHRDQMQRIARETALRMKNIEKQNAVIIANQAKMEKQIDKNHKEQMARIDTVYHNLSEKIDKVESDIMFELNHLEFKIY